MHQDFHNKHMSKGRPTSTVLDSASDVSCISSNSNFKVMHSEAPSSNTPDIDLQSAVAMFLMKLREFHKVSGKACGFVSSELANILQVFLEKERSHMQALLLQANISSSNISDIMNGLRLNYLESVFLNFTDSRSLNRYVKGNLEYVDPVEYVLETDTQGKCHSFQYIPLLKTLTKLLKHPDILAEVMQGHSSSDGKLRDYCDGTFYKSNNLFKLEEPSLQIQLYFDDFTIVNPLGNKTKRHKLGAFYFVLGNLPPQCRSKLHVIQLLILCRSIDLKTFGYGTLLRPLIQDLKVLEQDGIEVEVNKVKHSFRGTVSFVSADNLAAHSLGGFNESFNSLRISRFCMVTKAEKNHCVNAETCDMRTIQTYNAHISMVTQDPEMKSVYGVKMDSPLNQLSYFHVIQGLPSDIAHDLFEGIVPEVLGKLTVYCVEKGFFSNEYVNDQINSFPYGEVDKSNKPSKMATVTSNFVIQQTAMQCWCLLRLFPMLVGDKVPEGDTKWNVLNNLMFMVEAMCAPIVSQADVVILSDLIEEFLCSYREQFPSVNLRPKYHYALHYPSQMLQYGPLLHCWTMRFEGKHNYFKEIAHGIKNRRNVCKTLAVRHQFMQSIHYTSENFLETEKLDNVNGKHVHVRLLLNEVQDLLQPLLGDKEKVYQCPCMKVNGVKFCSGTCVVLPCNDSTMPVFGVIEECYIIGGIPYLLCAPTETLDFCYHYHSYILRKLERFILIKPTDIFAYHPLDMYPYPFDKSLKMVTLRHKISV